MAPGLLLNRFASAVLCPLKGVVTSLPRGRLSRLRIGQIHPNRDVPSPSTFDNDVLKFGSVGIGLLSLHLIWMKVEYDWKKPLLLAEIADLEKRRKAAWENYSAKRLAKRLSN